MSSYAKQLHLARATLIAAGVLVVVAHWLPLEFRYVHRYYFPYVGREPFSLIEEWKDMPFRLNSAFHGVVTVRDVGGPCLLIWVSFMLVALPFLARFLARARAILWTMRLMAVGVAGWWLVISGLQDGVRVGIGWTVLSGGLWLMVLGLLLIPDASPTAKQCNWKMPMAMLAGYALVMASQRRVRLELSHLDRPRFTGMCVVEVYALQSVLENYRRSTGHLPSAARNWEALLPTQTAGNFLISIPIDPWGNPYRYTDRAVGAKHGADESANIEDVTISSDGPDGLPGTSDDFDIDFYNQ